MVFAEEEIEQSHENQGTVHLLTFRSFPGFSTQQVPTFPRMVRFSRGLSVFRGARVRRVSGSAGPVVIAAVPGLALRGVERPGPVLPYDSPALGPKQRRGSVPRWGRGRPGARMLRLRRRKPHATPAPASRSPSAILTPPCRQPHRDAGPAPNPAGETRLPRPHGVALQCGVPLRKATAVPGGE